MPRESPDGNMSTVCRTKTKLKASRPRRSISSSETSCSSISRKATFSRTVSESNSALSWKTIPMFRRSEEHTSELQSRLHLVCRLLLEKKKNPKQPAVPSPNHRQDHEKRHEGKTQH